MLRQGCRAKACQSAASQHRVLCVAPVKACDQLHRSARSRASKYKQRAGAGTLTSPHPSPPIQHVHHHGREQLPCPDNNNNNNNAKQAPKPAMRHTGPHQVEDERGHGVGKHDRRVERPVGAAVHVGQLHSHCTQHKESNGWSNRLANHRTTRRSCGSLSQRVTHNHTQPHRRSHSRRHQTSSACACCLPLMLPCPSGTSHMSWV